MDKALSQVSRYSPEELEKRIKKAFELGDICLTSQLKNVYNVALEHNMRNAQESHTDGLK